MGGFTALSWPVVEVADTVGDVSTFYYNGRHQRTGVSFANGRTVTNVYGGDGFWQQSIEVGTGATNTYKIYRGASWRRARRRWG